LQYSNRNYEHTPASIRTSISTPSSLLSDGEKKYLLNLVEKHTTPSGCMRFSGFHSVCQYLAKPQSIIESNQDRVILYACSISEQFADQTFRFFKNTNREIASDLHIHTMSVICESHLTESIIEIFKQSVSKRSLILFDLIKERLRNLVLLRIKATRLLLPRHMLSHRNGDNGLIHRLNAFEFTGMANHVLDSVEESILVLLDRCIDSSRINSQEIDQIKFKELILSHRLSFDRSHISNLMSLCS